MRRCNLGAWGWCPAWLSSVVWVWGMILFVRMKLKSDNCSCLLITYPPKRGASLPRDDHFWCIIEFLSRDEECHAISPSKRKPQSNIMDLCNEPLQSSYPVFCFATQLFNHRKLWFYLTGRFKGNRLFLFLFCIVIIHSLCFSFSPSYLLLISYLSSSEGGMWIKRLLHWVLPLHFHLPGKQLGPYNSYPHHESVLDYSL